MEKKSFYKDASVNTHSIFGVAAFGMILTSIYLTQHYFQIHYPTSLSSGSLCNLNSFFNCDGTTLSPASNIFGIPISVFGIMTGLILLGGYFLKDDEAEGTIYNLLAINLAGCVILFLYSLIAIGSLCPFCSLYYLFSAVTFIIVHRRSTLRKFSPKFVVIMAALYLIPGGITLAVVKNKENNNQALEKSLMDQYRNAPKISEPSTPSEFKLNTVENAPVQINIFSDFQCPACKAMSDVAHQIIKRYKDKVNMNYYFYPLDNNCNSAITRSFHTLACKAAYVAACIPEKFAEVHDKIFAMQDKLTAEWISKYARELGVYECSNKIETKLKVQQIIEMSSAYNVQSTPTISINGVKIEGILPPNQLFILIDNLIKEKNGK